MRSKWLEKARRQKPEQLFYGAFALLLLSSLFTATATEQYLFLGLPAIFLVIFLTVVDFRLVFFLLIACLPFSTEYSLPNGFATDLPTEPLIVGLMLVYLLYLFRHRQEIDGAFFRHPITLLLLLHLGWIAVTALTSADPFVSIKFFLAKAWYVITFYFLAGLLLRQVTDVRRLFWFLFVPLTSTMVIVLVRHAASGFSFAEVNRVLSPFYRNHVAYASIMVVFFPMLWFVRGWYPRGTSLRRLLTASIGIYLMAIYFSYTRAAYVSVVLVAGAYLIIRWRLTRLTVAAALIGVLGFVLFFAYDNRYLELSPDYEHTITHEDFGNLLEATYQGEDLSTMERVYRWVAGFYMTQARPWLGFGPGTFFFFYKPYTVSSFRTYVSDNPDSSGIHNYYLMVAVEQGYPGLLILLFLVFAVLVRGEEVYHRLGGRQEKEAAMMVLLSFIVILALLIINDLVETDKVGPFFFFTMAILVNFDRLDPGREAGPG